MKLSKNFEEILLVLKKFTENFEILRCEEFLKYYYDISMKFCISFDEIKMFTKILLESGEYFEKYEEISGIFCKNKF